MWITSLAKSNFFDFLAAKFSKITDHYDHDKNKGLFKLIDPGIGFEKSDFLKINPMDLFK
jgi:hypothetical protein